MKIYLAAPFSKMDILREHAKQLRAAGHECTSGWLRERKDPNADIEEGENYRKHAERDIIDIDRSDEFTVFTVDPKEWIKRGGKHFEAGYAYARNKSLVYIGPRENIFYFLPEWEHYDSFEEYLGKRSARKVG
jgi:nucleoside 2-deoxyribosyltransferase